TTMVVQHGPKALVFGIAGFVFKEWLALVVLMIAAGAVGTKLGLLRLFTLSERRFSFYFNLVLSLIAVRLLWQALPGLWPTQPLQPQHRQPTKQQQGDVVV